MFYVENCEFYFFIFLCVPYLCFDDKKVEKVNWVWVGMPTRIERLLYLEGN
jgi:hypothetical protein